MPQVTSALASLLPVIGAVALTVRGVGRMRRTRSGEPPRPVMQPMEPAAPPPRIRAPLPDAACAVCGTSIPAGTLQCAPCARAAAGPDATLRATLLHWLILAGGLAFVIGTGWLLAG